MTALKHSTSSVTAVFICRWILGLVFTMAGWWKVFDLGAAEHARQFFVDGFAESWIPLWLLWGLGVFIPYLELVAGLLILAGFKLRWALTAVGLLLVVTTYGHALQQPLFDIDGHTFTRLALIVFLLTMGTGRDRATIDFWLTGKDGSANASDRNFSLREPGEHAYLSPEPTLLQRLDRLPDVPTHSAGRLVLPASQKRQVSGIS